MKNRKEKRKRKNEISGMSVLGVIKHRLHELHHTGYATLIVRKEKIIVFFG